MWKDKNNVTRLTTDPEPQRKVREPGTITSDPYVTIKIGKETFKTNWIKRNLNPMWNEVHVFKNVQVRGAQTIVLLGPCCFVRRRFSCRLGLLVAR